MFTFALRLLHVVVSLLHRSQSDPRRVKDSRRKIISPANLDKPIDSNGSLHVEHVAYTLKGYAGFRWSLSREREQ